MASTWNSGTNLGNMWAEMKSKLGQPEYHQSWYLKQYVSGTPTSTDINTFESNLWVDIVCGMPVSGGAFMVAGRYRDGTPYPHSTNSPT